MFILENVICLADLLDRYLEQNNRGVSQMILEWIIVLSPAAVTTMKE